MSEKKKKEITPPKKKGPPTQVSRDIFIEICTRLSNGEDIVKILKSDLRFPAFETFCRWKRNDKELQELYAHAREDKAELFEHKINLVLDDLGHGRIDQASARVIIDTLKWQASKSAPKQYGDKLDVTTDGRAMDSVINVKIHEPKED